MRARSCSARRARWALAGLSATLMALAGCTAGPDPTATGTSPVATASTGAGLGTDAPSPSLSPSPSVETQTPAPAARQDPPVVAGVSGDRRYLVDQRGAPILLHAETIWAVTKSLSVDETVEHLRLRASQGFNAVLVSPFPWIGKPGDSRFTQDGLQPFDGSVDRLDPAYWARFDSILATARSLGITVFIAPGGADVGFKENGYAYDARLARSFGAALAARYRGVPGIVWLLGVDYYREYWTTYDPMMRAFVEGLRNGGDTHPVTVQLGTPSTSSDSPGLRDIVDLEAVYTYRPTYAEVLTAYARDAGPTILIEANFEGENNEGGPPTTNATLRRQTLWTLTSGGVGATYGNRQVWQFADGWQRARDTTAVKEMQVEFDLFDSIEWWRLVPDARGAFLVSGRGADVTTGTENGGFADVLESDRATAAISPDGTLAVVYVPTARTIGIDRSRLAASVSAWWVDPTTGSRREAAISDRFTTPGTNAAGAADWILLFGPA